MNDPGLIPAIVGIFILLISMMKDPFIELIQGIREREGLWDEYWKRVKTPFLSLKEGWNLRLKQK